MASFVGELEDVVRAFNRDLLALERAASPGAHDELVRSLFREAHSLKGAARAVRLGLIEAVCHRLEALLADLRDGRIQLHPELFELLFAAADALGDAAARLRQGAGLESSSLQGLLPRLEA